MGRKYNVQEKAWLESNANGINHIAQCVICQNKGYDEKKLASAKSEIFIGLMKKHFHPIELDQNMYCSECEGMKG